MKLSNTLFIAVLCVASIIVSQCGEAEQKTSDTRCPEEKSVKKEIKVEEEGVAKDISGSIVKIDKPTKTITIEAESGDCPVTLDGNTIVVADKKEIKCSELKMGDHVVIKYRQLSDGKNMATHIDDKTLAEKLSKEE